MKDAVTPPSLIGLDVASYKLSLRRRLTINKVTFREVCDELGVDHTKLSNWIRPGKDMYLSTVCKIEQAVYNILQRRETVQGVHAEGDLDV